MIKHDEFLCKCFSGKFLKINNQPTNYKKKTSYSAKRSPYDGIKKAAQWDNLIKLT